MSLRSTCRQGFNLKGRKDGSVSRLWLRLGDLLPAISAALRFDLAALASYATFASSQSAHRGGEQLFLLGEHGRFSRERGSFQGQLRFAGRGQEHGAIQRDVWTLLEFRG
jgi:hypothetical protein